MAKPPHTRAEMRAFYPVCQVAELAAGYGYTTLRKAGALILAKAHLTELALGGTPLSSLGGQTRNLYDLLRTPGGSSGGTAAAIAANFGMVGTGSDTGQSTRLPASACTLAY
jgi:Asp-tRNA(Asn)/Glu-tRNA(Gln) amidotransferase A subunit family amidase